MTAPPRGGSTHRWVVEEDQVPLAREVRRGLEVSNRRAQDWIRRGAVRVDGSIVRELGHRVTSGATIEVSPETPRRGRGRPEGQVRILLEDLHLVVVEKPAGLLTVPREEDLELPPDRREPSVEDELRARYLRRKERPTIRIVQRLDRGTSGILVLVRSQFAYDILKPAFARHEIERRYRAIVVGTPPSREGSLRHRLVERRGRVIVAHPKEAEGKDAVSHYQVIASRSARDRSDPPRVSLLELALETGRRNQIRVGCAVEGFPILGDPTYGEASAVIGRPALHARVLGFLHPRSGEPLRFETDEPADFRAAWDSFSPEES